MGRCHCLGWLGMMAMAAVWYADLGRCGLLSLLYKACHIDRAVELFDGFHFESHCENHQRPWHTLVPKRALICRSKDLTARIWRRAKESWLIVPMRMRSLVMKNKGKLFIELTGGWLSYLGTSKGCSCHKKFWTSC